MKEVLYIGAIILLLPIMGVAGNDAGRRFEMEATLKAFLTPNAYSEQSIESFQAFVTKLDRKRNAIKTDHDFVKYVFYKTHQRFLKNYTADSSLDDTFKDGTYNCLSGTILYTLILNHFNISHEVIETNYHIFILAETTEGKVLIEATDPLNGFVAVADEIEKRITLYKQNEVTSLAPTSNKAHYKFRYELFNRVSLNELRGLLHYNRAVNTFNQQQLSKAVTHLVQAYALYSSPRMDEFSQLILLALQASELTTKTKEDCMRAILLLQQQSLSVAAN